MYKVLNFPIFLPMRLQICQQVVVNQDMQNNTVI